MARSIAYDGSHTDPERRLKVRIHFRTTSFAPIGDVLKAIGEQEAWQLIRYTPKLPALQRYI
jgi:hypothetical protein